MWYSYINLIFYWSAASWYGTPCSLVKYKRFAGMCCLHLQKFPPKHSEDRYLNTYCHISIYDTVLCALGAGRAQ